jgi:hypothetical protein
MEGLIKRVAEKWLSIFIRDYHIRKKDLDLALWKGDIRIPEIELNTGTSIHRQEC